MNPIEFNLKLDEQLLSSGRLDAELFAQLMDAYTYDAASTVGWVQAKLKVLQTRIITGEQLFLYEPLQGSVLSVSSLQDFLGWVSQHFPVAKPQP